MNQSASINSSSGKTAAVSGELTFATVAALCTQGEALLAGESPVRKFDLKEVTRIDSSGLALLLEWQSRARANGAGITIMNAPDHLARLARLCEAEDLLQLDNDPSTD